MKECDFSVNDSLENLIQKIKEYKNNHKNAKDVSKDVSKEYKKAVKILKKAYIYVHRLGVFENGIDNEAEFLALLEKNLDEMKEN